MPGSFAVGLAHVCRSEGLDEAALFFGLAPPPGRRAAREAMPWPVAAALLERLEGLRPSALRALAEQLAGACVLACVSSRAFESSRTLFDAALREWPRYWGVLDASQRDGDGWHVVMTRLRSPFRPCEAFFRLQAEVLRLLPAATGSAPVEVDALIQPGAGLYRVSLARDSARAEPQQPTAQLCGEL